MGVCMVFGVTDAEAVHFFIIAELFMSIFNIGLGFYSGYHAYEISGTINPGWPVTLGRRAEVNTRLAAYSSLSAGLLFQGCVGLTLYPLKKIKAIYWVWIVAAVFNLGNYFFMIVVHCMYPIKGKINWGEIASIQYLLYVVIGIMVLAQASSSSNTVRDSKQKGVHGGILKGSPSTHGLEEQPQSLENNEEFQEHLNDLYMKALTETSATEEESETKRHGKKSKSHMNKAHEEGDVHETSSDQQMKGDTTTDAEEAPQKHKDKRKSKSKKKHKK